MAAACGALFYLETEIITKYFLLEKTNRVSLNTEGHLITKHQQGNHGNMFYC